MSNVNAASFYIQILTNVNVVNISAVNTVRIRLEATYVGVTLDFFELRMVWAVKVSVCDSILFVIVCEYT